MPAGKIETENEFFVYIGTGNPGKSLTQGIYLCRFNADKGLLSPVGLVAETVNPTCLAVDPYLRFLFAVNQTTDCDSRNSGTVSAFALDRATGKLAIRNQISSLGALPCYLVVDRTGRYVLVANYVGASIAAFPILGDGSLGRASAFAMHTGSSVNLERQKAPHPHSIDLSPDNRFALAADLGADQLVVYRFDQECGSLEPNDSPFIRIHPGSGPRHSAFHPNGRFVYLINEMASTVTAFAYDIVDGRLRELQTISTLPRDFRGENNCAEIEVHPTGKFLYGSNRGHDSIAVFAIESARGTLTPIEYAHTQGKTPVNFKIDPAGLYLLVANQDSGNTVVFRLDPGSGCLISTGQILEVPSTSYVFVAITNKVQVS